MQWTANQPHNVRGAETSDPGSYHYLAVCHVALSQGHRDIIFLRDLSNTVTSQEAEELRGRTGKLFPTIHYPPLEYGRPMKRLTLTLLLTFGLAFPASGQGSDETPPYGPYGYVGDCAELSRIMFLGRRTLLYLMGEMWDQSYNLKEGSEETRGAKVNLLVGEGEIFDNMDTWMRTTTHVHEMARDAWESACMEDDK